MFDSHFYMYSGEYLDQYLDRVYQFLKAQLWWTERCTTNRNIARGDFHRLSSLKIQKNQFQYFNSWFGREQGDELDLEVNVQVDE